MSEVVENDWLELPSPLPMGSNGHAAFRAVGLKLAALCRKGQREADQVHVAVTRTLADHKVATQHRQTLKAASLVLADLTRQGWGVIVRKENVRVRPPAQTQDRALEKARVRSQESVKRDEQLRKPAVVRFIRSVERKRAFKGESVSIFSLMRDGPDLASSLQRARFEVASGRVKHLQTRVEPYVQVVAAAARCEHTGFKLQDVWRYFRHTWVTPYESVPGRCMMFLVRDRAAKFHPVIGIAALSSPIVQLGQRDRWLGWEPDVFIDEALERPSAKLARWLLQTTDEAFRDITASDFIERQVISRADLRSPTPSAVEALRRDAEKHAKAHKDFAKAQDYKRARRHDADTDEFWQQRSRTRLFRWRRAALLADLLAARAVLKATLGTRPSAASVRRLLSTTEGRRAVRFIVRKAKADRVGIAMADISVCGAVAPYNAILGGKLVSMLAVSPQVVNAYRQKYADAQSEIASAMAGRAIVRPPHLVFLGTTSLYGLGSSQYNRIRIPCDRLGGKVGASVVFEELGRSEAFGSSHFSGDTLKALADLTSHVRERHEVRNVFGEGVSPRLRKVRHGLELLGFNANALLRHGRKRVIYGVALAENTREYLLGLAKRPRYLAPIRRVEEASATIASWWIERWLARRIESDDVLSMVSDHSTAYPVRHGARVVLPSSSDQLSFLWAAE